MFQCVWRSADWAEYRYCGKYDTAELAREHFDDEQAQLIKEVYGDREAVMRIEDGFWFIIPVNE